MQAYLANKTEDNKFNFQTCQFRINPKFYLCDYVKTTNTKEMGIVLIFCRSAAKRKRIFYHLSSVFSRLRESGLHLLTINAKERGRTNRLEIELKCHGAYRSR